MDEAQWLSCTEPRRMLRHLAGQAGERRLRLFAAACCRLAWDHVGDCRRAVEMTADYADGLLTTREFRQAIALAWEVIPTGRRARGWASQAVQEDAWYAAVYISGDRPAVAQREAARRATAEAIRRGMRGKDVGRFAGLAAREAKSLCLRQQCDLVRDIFGNPFRKVVIDRAWLTPDVSALAGAISREYRYADLPVLADALEDAACTDENILQHLRGTTPHVRGCWAVDLLVGRVGGWKLGLPPGEDVGEIVAHERGLRFLVRLQDGREIVAAVPKHTARAMFRIEPGERVRVAGIGGARPVVVGFAC